MDKVTHLMRVWQTANIEGTSPLERKIPKRQAILGLRNWFRVQACLQVSDTNLMLSSSHGLFSLFGCLIVDKTFQRNSGDGSKREQKATQNQKMMFSELGVIPWKAVETQSLVSHQWWCHGSLSMSWPWNMLLWKTCKQTLLWQSCY